MTFDVEFTISILLLLLLLLLLLYLKSWGKESLIIVNGVDIVQICCTHYTPFVRFMLHHYFQQMSGNALRGTSEMQLT